MNKSERNTMAPFAAASGSAAVRRNNLKSKTSFPPENEGVSSSTALNMNDIEAPLHHRATKSNGTDGGGPSSSTTTTNGFGKRAKRPPRKKRNNKVYVCGIPLDIPLVGVLCFLLIGMVFLVHFGSLAFRSTKIEAAELEHAHEKPHHPHHHHKENPHSDVQRREEGKSPKHHKPGGHHHSDHHTNDGPKKHQKSGAHVHKHHNAAAAVEDRALDIPDAPVRVLHSDTDYEYYDVVIAGAGPSGLTAALFAARAGLRVHVLGSPTTGLLSQTKVLDNFPSFNSAAGPRWLESTLAQAKSWGATFGPPGLLATKLERNRLESKEDAFFTLTTSSSKPIHAWSVIVASGATPRTLGLPHEDQLWGNSLHSCAICDGHLYQATTAKPTTRVLVVGGGDAAVDGALLLARYATEVIVVHRREDFSKVKNRSGLDRLRSTPNIKVQTPYTVQEWIVQTDDPTQLVGALLKHGTATDTTRLDIDGAFVMIGATPNTEWMHDSGIALDEEGLVRTHADLPSEARIAGMITASSIPGLFAAGEVTDKHYKQAITAASAGAQAAIDAERWLREQTGITVAARPPEPPVEEKAEPNESEEKDELASCDMTTEDCIRSIVEKYPVVVFSKASCPYCRKALEALSRAGVQDGNPNLLVVRLDKQTNTQAIQSTLQGMTGRRTVPNVFVDGKSIGGGDETHALEQDGNLAPLLEKSGALEVEEPEEESNDEGENKEEGSNDGSNDEDNSNNGEEISPEKARKMEEWNKIQAEKPPLPGHFKAKPPSKEEQAKQDEARKNKVPIRHSSTESEPCDVALESCFKELVQKYPILLVSLSWCPECKREQELLDLIGVPKDQIHILDLDDYSEEVQLNIREHMKAMTGRRWVPNLFVGGEYVGGFRDSDALHSEGELIPLFQKVGAISATADDNGSDGDAPIGHSSTESEPCDVALESCFKELVQKYPILLVSLSGCIECKREHELLDLIGVPKDQIHILDLADYPENVQMSIREHMKVMSGRRGVPNLFVGGEYVGDRALKSKRQLMPLFQKLGVIPATAES